MCLFFQNISVSERFSKHVSTDYLCNRHRNDAVKICMPNVYFQGYFPQYCSNKYNTQAHDGTRGGENGLFPYGDKNIQRRMSVLKPNCIARELLRNDFYTKEERLRNVEKSLDELREREKKCDVIISDYIEEHYRDIRLFYSNNHPINELLKELMIRVFERIDVDARDIQASQVSENNGREQFLYPSVAHHLGIKWAKDNVYVIVGTRLYCSEIANGLK